MTDTLNQGTEPGEAGEGTENGNIKHLREQAKEAETLRAENTALKREKALGAVIDASTPLGQFFAEKYDGDINDPEAVKAAATALGVPIIGATAGEATTTGEAGAAGTTGEAGDAGAGETDPNGTAARSDLAGGAPPDTGLNPDPREGALKTAQEALVRGATEDAAMGGFLNKIAEAASKGDPRVIYDERTAR